MQRFDTVALIATRTSEGFIRDAPIVGRTGILHYINADGSDRYEYRPPEEAFDADSLASLMGKPITDIHRNADGTMGFTFKREVELSNTPNPWDNLVVDGIAEVNAATQAKADNRIYTLDGRFLGTDMKALKSGMYIVNGKKILK